MILLKKIVLFLLLVFIVFLVLVLSILVWPSLLVNQSAINWTLSRYLPEYKVDWQNIDIHFQYNTLFNKQLVVKGENVCFFYFEEKVCLDNIDIRARLNLLDKKIFYFDGIKIEDQQTKINLAKAKRYLEENSLSGIGNQQEESIIDLPDNFLNVRRGIYLLRDVLPDEFQLRLKEIEIDDGGKLSRLSLDWTKNNLLIVFSQADSLLRVQARRSNSQDKVVDVDSAFTGDFIFSNRNMFVQSNFSLQISPESISFQDAAKMGVAIEALQGDVFNFNEIESVLRKTKDKKVFPVLLSMQNRLSLSKSKAQLEIQAMKAVYDSYFDTSEKGACHVVIFLDAPKEKTNYTCSGLVLAAVQNRAKQFFGKSTKFFPLSFSLSATGELANKLSMSSVDASFLSSRITFLTDSTHHSLRLNGLIDIAVSLQDEKVVPEFKKLNWDVNINDFKTFVRNMRGSKFFVPAPFNQLEGSLRLFSKELVQASKDAIALPIQAELRLNESKQNKLSIDAVSKIIFNTKNQKIEPFTVSATINQLFLFLPEIDPLSTVPSLAADDRISAQLNKSNGTNKIKSNDEKEQASNLVTVKWQTKNTDSIRLYYYLIQPYLPFATKGEVSSLQQFSVAMANQEVQLNYLKRTLKLEKFQLEKEEKSDLISVDLRIKYQVATYDIFIDVLGPIDSPYIDLSSRPELSRQDIISLILYHRRNDEVSSFQKESVSSTEAAISDRALGIFSVWAFASTPIESVSYDAQTKEYAAYLALPGDIRLKIGTDWESQRSVGLRKRISSTWAVVSTFRSGDAEQGTGDLFIEKRIDF